MNLLTCMYACLCLYVYTVCVYVSIICVSVYICVCLYVLFIYVYVCVYKIIFQCSVPQLLITMKQTDSIKIVCLVVYTVK